MDVIEWVCLASYEVTEKHLITVECHLISQKLLLIFLRVILNKSLLHGKLRNGYLRLTLWHVKKNVIEVKQSSFLLIPIRL